MRIVGSANSVPYEALKSTFDGLTINTELPGQTSALLAKTSITISIPSGGATMAGTSYLFLNNPLATAFSVTHVTGQITKDGQVIGTIDQDFSGNPLSVPAGAQSYQVGPVQVSLKGSFTSMSLLIGGLQNGGSALVDLASTLGTLVGSYPTTIKL